MTRNVILSLFAICLSTISSSVYASNGNTLIGISPVSTSLGGTGVAATQNSTDAMYKNPATLSELTGKSGQIAVEMSGNLVKVNSSANVAAAAGEKTSSNPAKLLPAIGASYKLSDQMAVGLGLVAHGGAAVDYKGEASMLEIKTDYQMVRILPTFSYHPTETFSFGVSPVIAYNAFSLNTFDTRSNPVVGTQSTREPHGSTALGAQVGATVHPVQGLTLGAAFLSKTSFTFKDTIDLDVFGVNATNAALAGLDQVKIEQPMELAFGTAYKVIENLSLSADYRFINWSKADSYKELGWRDQHVISFGAEYLISKLALRAGFNYGRSPIADISGETGATATGVDFQGHSVHPASISKLNAIAFPAYTESHLTLGAGYAVNEKFSIDSSFVYAFKKSITRSGTTTAAYTFQGNASQWQVGLGGRYLFE